MARKFKLRAIESESEVFHEKSGVIDRREFMRLSFNTAAGLITTASLGSVGFASFLMGQAEGGTSDSSIKFYVPKGSDVWYGNCLLYTSPSPRDLSTSRMPSSA